MSDYSDDDDFEEPAPSLSSATTIDVADPSDLQSLAAMMYKARAQMNEFKMGLDTIDISNLETESIATPEALPPPTRLVTPSTPPPRYADRSSWIKASRGEGQETRQEVEQEGDSETKQRDPAPGLSTHVTVIRKRAPSVSFAPPKHVEKVVPKVPPPKQVRLVADPLHPCSSPYPPTHLPSHSPLLAHHQEREAREVGG